MSTLPTSYPGHNIITKDIGEIVEDRFCKCETGKRFLIYRAEKPNQEVVVTLLDEKIGKFISNTK